METHDCAKRAVVIVALASSLFARTAGNQANKVTCVSGESWLAHLGRSFNETSMGKTGRLGPPSLAPRAERESWSMGLAPEAANESVTLHGSDLYRMNCRGCHGKAGQGAPPEINSVINPVRATSAAVVMERMKTAGMDLSRADAEKLARQSKTMLLERLHHGGQDMPAFPHLGDAGVNSLLAYLRQLAGVRGAKEEQIAVRESRVRVGEYIVKSTCHVCHSATGPNPTAWQLYEGAIPPLNTLALRKSQTEFIRKVTHGAPVMMGAPPQLFRGRMPVFYYLSEDEAADVYLYLTRYPPYQWATLDPVSTPNPTSVRSQPNQGTLDPEPQLAGASITSSTMVAEDDRAATRGADPKFASLQVLVGLIAFVLLVLGFGLGFTVWELRRLSATTPRIGDRIDFQTSAAAAECPEDGNERMDGELVA